VLRGLLLAVYLCLLLFASIMISAVLDTVSCHVVSCNMLLTAWDILITLPILPSLVVLTQRFAARSLVCSGSRSGLDWTDISHALPSFCRGEDAIHGLCLRRVVQFDFTCLGCWSVSVLGCLAVVFVCLFIWVLLGYRNIVCAAQKHVRH
jgi:hypothetical protein